MGFSGFDTLNGFVHVLGGEDGSSELSSCAMEVSLRIMHRWSHNKSAYFPRIVPSCLYLLSLIIVYTRAGRGMKIGALRQA